MPHPSLSFSSLNAFEAWAHAEGVAVEVLGALGTGQPLTLQWIERQPTAQRGAGQRVIQALADLAQAHAQSLELVCLAGSLESYYAELGFLSDLSSRDEDTGDVVMRRLPRPSPAVTSRSRTTVPQRRRA